MLHVHSAFANAHLEGARGSTGAFPLCLMREGCGGGLQTARGLTENASTSDVSIMHAIVWEHPICELPAGLCAFAWACVHLCVCVFARVNVRAWDLCLCEYVDTCMCVRACAQARA